MPGLSVSDLVSVDVNLSPTATPVRNFGALLLLGASDIIDTTERLREYSSLTGVASDFGTTAPEYLAADLFYSQSPQPSTLYIAKWNQTASKGRLYGGALTTAQQALTNFTSVTTGSMKITVDGSLKTLASLDFSGVTNLNGVASIVTTALSGAIVTWDAANSRFVVKSPTTGISSIISFGEASVSGVDISALMNLTSALGAKAVDGLAAETMLAGVQALADASNAWFGLAIAASSLQVADLVAVAGYVQATSPKRFFVVTSQDANTLSSGSTTDLAYQLKALAYNNTFVQYSSSSPYAAVSAFGRIASTNFQANNSMITLAFKQEPGVVAETLSETQFAVLKTKNCNVFVNFNNATAILIQGKVSSGQFADSIIGLAWLQNQAQTDVYNLLYTSLTKIPQKDAGVSLITATLEATMDSAVNNGLLAPGVWTGPAMGPLQTNQTLSKGYFVYAPSVASQSAADRAARKSPAIQIAAKLGGAIHEVDVVININQ